VDFGKRQTTLVKDDEEERRDLDSIFDFF